MTGWRGYRPAWIRVDLERIASNVRRLATASAPADLMAVVKADGYGHGAGPVSRAALASGARRLCVGTPEEGRALRREGIAAPILVLGAFVPGQEEAFHEYRLTATVASVEAAGVLARFAQRRGVAMRVHLKVDSGMGRLGVLAEEVPFTVRRLLRLEGIEVEGIFSHLASADVAGLPGVRDQVRRFQAAVAGARSAGCNPAVVHLCNTAGVLEGVTVQGANAVRPGIGIYGLYPSQSVQRAVELQPALSLHAQVVSVKRVPPGTGVSYGHTYRTAKATTLCIVPVGYADGISRQLSNQAEVLLGGRRFPLVGRVCMNQCVIDVGDHPVEVGDEVTLLGQQGDDEITADEWAERIGSINYEVVCMLSGRLERVYGTGRR